jgi:hypothetical protein
MVTRRHVDLVLALALVLLAPQHWNAQHRQDHDSHHSLQPGDESSPHLWHAQDLTGMDGLRSQAGGLRSTVIGPVPLMLEGRPGLSARAFSSHYGAHQFPALHVRLQV